MLDAYRLVKMGPQALKNVSFPIDVYKLELPWQASRINKQPGRPLRFVR